MKRAVLIDGSSLIFRAFYAIPNLSTKDGVPTNGVYGFLTMFYRVLNEYKPDYLLVAFDRSTPTFRAEDYEAYKAGREDTPSELNAQFGILQEVLDALNVAHLDMDGYEADDIIGTLSREFEKEGIETFLITGDRDFLQLADDKVSVVLTRRGISETEVYDKAKYIEEYGINPHQLIEVMGLMGDPSDNIPGVPGIGEKTAMDLIKRFGSIDGVYENIDKVTGKVRVKNLMENKDTAYMSRNLAEIFLNVPMDKSLAVYKSQEPNEEMARELFEKLEFRTFASYLPSAEVDEIKNTYVDLGLDNLKDLLEAVQSSKSLYFKFFYDDEKYIHSKVAAAGFKAGGSKDIYVHRLEEGDFLEEDLRSGQLGKVFGDDKIEKISHDLKPDIYYLSSLGIDIKNYQDSMIMDYLIDPSEVNLSVERQATVRLGLQIRHLEEIQGKGKNKKLISEISEEDFFSYVNDFVSIVEKSLPIQVEILKERDMWELYKDVELPLIKVLSSMERIGIEVDLAVLEDIKKETEGSIDELAQKIYKLAGKEFNISSPKQLGEILFEDLKLPVIRRTKTGYSTDARVLDSLMDKHDIIPLIGEYRSITKLMSTYVEALGPLVSEDGRLRTTFRQNVTATGRISSQDPNLQNIPIRTEDGRRIRKAFVAKEGSVFLDADYSQIELRILAHLSGDEVMLQAFRDGEDIHTKTASQVFHTPMDQVTPLQRDRAKAVNFGIVYGISDYGLSQGLKITRKEAKHYIDSYKATYPGISKYMDEIIEKGKEDGYVETILHRRRYIPELKESNANIRGFGERVALNTPIQGSAADIIKIAMDRVYDRLREEGLEAMLVLQVHDELIIEAPEAEADHVEALLREVMEGAMKLKVDLVADVSRGKTWYDC